MVALARAEIDLEALAALPDDEVKSRLVALRGIGEWTAEWFLARHLARPHAWPVGRRRAAQGSRASLWWARRPRSARALPPVREPLRPLSLARAHRLQMIRNNQSRTDLTLVHELWRAFNAEVKERRSTTRTRTRSSRRWSRVSENVRLLADDDGSVALRTRDGGTRSARRLLYVRPGRAKRQRRGGASPEAAPRAASGRRPRCSSIRSSRRMPARARSTSASGFRPSISARSAARRARGAPRRSRRADSAPSTSRPTTRARSSATVPKVLPRTARRGTTVDGPHGWMDVRDESRPRSRELRRLAQGALLQIGGVALALGVEDGTVVR